MKNKKIKIVDIIGKFTYRYTTKTLDIIGKYVSINKNTRILEAGCGSGKNSILFSKKYYCKNDVLDYADKALLYSNNYENYFELN